MLLSKLVACRSSCRVQIVAMSATMTGLDSFSSWLDAHLFLTNFRPVPLTEYAVFAGTVYVKSSGSAGKHSSSRATTNADKSAGPGVVADEAVWEAC
jgi:DNA polymerase theta